jgi:hypothetical protein
MRAINHALTGALIGLTVPEPLIAVPLAVASHFVLDALPHYGVTKSNNEAFMRSTRFKYYLVLDAVACVALVFGLAFSHPLNWLLAALCAFAAAAPDFASIGRWKVALRHKKFKPSSYLKFAIGIQWFERPIGVVVEVCWLIAGLFLISPFIR